jgi:hypothetical protein
MAHVLLNRLTVMPGKRDHVVRKLIESGQVFDDNPEPAVPRRRIRRIP